MITNHKSIRSTRNQEIIKNIIASVKAGEIQQRQDCSRRNTHPPLEDNRKRVHRSSASGWSPALSPDFCADFPPRLTLPTLPSPTVNQPPSYWACHRRLSPFPEGGTKQYRKCPDMSFRPGQFATWNWMIDSDNRSGCSSTYSASQLQQLREDSRGNDDVSLPTQRRKRIAVLSRHYSDSLSLLPAVTRGAFVPQEEKKKLESIMLSTSMITVIAVSICRTTNRRTFLDQKMSWRRIEQR